MVTVDDLVISLTIKETSKLGRLQKQLDSIVGKKGEKAPTFGLDASVKADLSAIKRRIIFLMPSTIPGKAKPYAMAETARIASSILEKDIRAYAKKIMPKDQNVLQRTMAEFGVETKDELVDVLEDKIKDWQLRLEEVMSRTWVNDQAQKFLVSIDDLIHRAEVPEGWSKVLMTNIDNAVGERNKEIADILKKLGLTVKPEQWIARIKPEFVKKMYPAEAPLQPGETTPRPFFKQNLEELMKAFKIEGKENKSNMGNLVKTYYDMKINTQELLEKLSDEFNINLQDLWNVTDKEVAKSEELRMVAALLTIVAQQASQAGLETGVPLGFQKIMWESLKKLRVGDTSKYSERMMEGVYKRFGKTFSDAFEKYRIDFLITDIQENIEIIKDLFGEKIATQLSDVQSLWVEQKKILSETNKGQFRIYNELVGSKRLIGLATHVMESFTSLFPKILTKTMNIATKGEEVGLKGQLTEAQKLEIKEEAESIFVEEKLLAGIGKLFEDQDSRQVDVKPEFKELYKALKTGFLGMKELFDAHLKKTGGAPSEKKETGFPEG